MRGHLCNARHARGCLGRAMNKHGIDAFSWCVLEDVNNDELDALEKHYIALFNTNCRRGGHGYNLDDGGRSRRNYKHTSDVKVKMKHSRRLYLERCPEFMLEHSGRMKKLWQDPVFRAKNTTVPFISTEQLRDDASHLTWDVIAAKYSISASTVKKWFVQLGIEKTSSRGSRRGWSIDEEQTLLRLYADDCLVRSIAVKLGCGECSVKKRIQLLCDRLGIPRLRYRRGT